MANPSAPPSYVEEKLKDCTRCGEFAASNTCISMEWMLRNWSTHGEILQCNPNVPEEILGKVSPISWKALSRGGGVSDEFVMKNVCNYTREVFQVEWTMSEKLLTWKLPENVVSKYKIPNEVLLRWGESVLWDSYCKSRYVSVNVLRHLVEEDKERDQEKKHLKEYAWKHLSCNRVVPIEFLLENEDKIDISWFMATHKVPLEFIKRKKVKDMYHIIESNPHLPLETCRDSLDSKGNRKVYLLTMGIICKNVHVTYEILKENEDIFKANPIPTADDYCIRKCWYALSGNPHTPMKFLEEHPHIIDWIKFSSNPSIPTRMVKENLRHVNWMKLSANSGFWKRLSEEELREILLEVFR